MITVDAGDWHSHFTDLAVQGCTFFDFLTVVDRDGRLEVLARVMNPESKQAHLVSCYCGDSILQSLSDVYPGSVWHEREAAEMFGVSFWSDRLTKPAASGAAGPAADAQGHRAGCPGGSGVAGLGGQ